MYICACGYSTENKQSYSAHKGHCKVDKDGNIIKVKGHVAWNKGLTKYTDERVKKCGETKKRRISSGEIVLPFLGKPLSEEHRNSISNSMKLAHKEGRAHNIGESRWNNEHSYPEKWLIGVLLNEFNLIENEDYKTEFPFHHYSLDFVFNNKVCIELDGDQHERFDYQINNDKRKDLKLLEEGWIEYRFKWRYIINNKLSFINQLKHILILSGNLKLLTN